MAINLAGVSFNDMKKQVYDSRDIHDRNTDTKLNFADTIIPNIQAMQVHGRVYAGVFPDMNQIEHDICSWY